MSSIDSLVDEVIDHNEEISQMIGQDPNLRNNLYEVVRQNYTRYKGALKGAEFVDKVDKVAGPLEAALQYFAPIGTPLYGIAEFAKVAEWGLLKLPYAIYYAVKTKDYSNVLSWTATEAAAHLIPFGNVIDVLPTYTKFTKDYFIKKSSEQFINSLSRKSVEPSAIELPEFLTQYHNARLDGGYLYLDEMPPGYDVYIDESDDLIKLYVSKSDMPYHRGWHKTRKKISPNKRLEFKDWSVNEITDSLFDKRFAA